MLIHDVTLLEIALDCGFQNHETFTRAFRRRFVMAPSRYRAWGRT
jgi:AraC family transcriptional regulator